MVNLILLELFLATLIVKMVNLRVSTMSPQSLNRFFTESLHLAVSLAVTPAVTPEAGQPTRPQRELHWDCIRTVLELHWNSIGTVLGSVLGLYWNSIGTVLAVWLAVCQTDSQAGRQAARQPDKLLVVPGCSCCSTVPIQFQYLIQ